MGSSTGAAAVLLCLALCVVAAASAVPEKKAHIITMAALEAPELSSSRKLIGGVYSSGFCPVRFDQTRLLGKIDSKCKGQEVPNPVCCQAFKDLACPYSDLLDELTTHCNTELFLKIHAFCNVPYGFFTMCGDSKEGITCPPGTK